MKPFRLLVPMISVWAWTSISSAQLSFTSGRISGGTSIYLIRHQTGTIETGASSQAIIA